MRLNHATRAIAVAAAIALATPAAADARGAGGGRSSSSTRSASGPSTSTSRNATPSRPTTSNGYQRLKRQEKLRDRLDYDDDAVTGSGSGGDVITPGDYESSSGSADRTPAPPAAEKLAAISDRMMRYVVWLGTLLIGGIGAFALLRLALGGGGGSSGTSRPAPGVPHRPHGPSHRTPVTSRPAQGAPGTRSRRGSGGRSEGSLGKDLGCGDSGCGD